MEQQTFEKITQKKEFSQLPKKDIEIAFSQFEKRQCSEEEKVRLTRALLRKVFSSFASQKLLSPKDKSTEWLLNKHLSTKERLPHYKELYTKLLQDTPKNTTLIDLGAGINGLSYNYFNNNEITYLGVESVGQLIDLMNNYFKKENLSKAKAVRLSLFQLEELKELIAQTQKPRIIFLFKTVDCLEMLERNYSKKLLLELGSLADKIVVSFAERSLSSKKKFEVKRYWFENFAKEHFTIQDDFVLGQERYMVLTKLNIC